jgi:hypothetical protein
MNENKNDYIFQYASSTSHYSLTALAICPQESITCQFESCFRVYDYNIFKIFQRISRLQNTFEC